MEVNKHINFLKRRGFLIEDSSQMELDFGVEDSLNFKSLCLDGSEVFCELLDLAEREGIKNDPELASKLVNSITKIYKYLKPPIRNNRSKFNRLVSVILNQKLENAVNTFDIIADVIDDVNIGELRKSINQLTDTEIELGDDTLLDIINKIKHQSYTNYENSFVGDHFEPYKTRLELDITGSEVLNETFTKVLLRVINGKVSPERLVNLLYDNIINNFRDGIGKFIKADLKCISPLSDEEGNLIISVGDYVEVKKLDYRGDSYLSEFFAIYKNPKKLPDELLSGDGMKVYNKIIDKLFTKLDGNDMGILDNIKSSFAGIIYEKNRFIPRQHIRLYWSNKGQRIDDHRLSIRYKVESREFNTYTYDTTSDVLRKDSVKIDVSNEYVYLPLVESINEDTVTDRGGRDWGRYSPQGKMIRTKGGTVPLDNEFDWARKYISDNPILSSDNPYAEALINVLGSSNVIGQNFEMLDLEHYGMRVFQTQNGNNWAVSTENGANNAKVDYVYDWVNDSDILDLPNIENYLELPWRWIRDYAEEETRDIVDYMDDEDVLDAWIERDNDYYKDEIKGIKDFEEELEGDLTDIDDEINRLNNRMSDMEAKNQDYLSYGYEEPRFTEEDFENIVNHIEELTSEREKLERRLENEIDDRWYDLYQSMREDLVTEIEGEIESDVERDPIAYFMKKHDIRNPESVIHQMDWEEYIDRDSLIDDIAEDTEYHQLSPYEEAETTEVDGRTYVLIRVN
jgi:hypothetical protein